MARGLTAVRMNGLAVSLECVIATESTEGTENFFAENMGNSFSTAELQIELERIFQESTSSVGSVDSVAIQKITINKR